MGLLAVIFAHFLQTGGMVGVLAARSDAAFAGALGFMCCLLVVPLVMMVPMVIGMWMVYEKAGEPGWSAIVPIYNVMVLARIVGREETWGLLCLVPVAGIYFLFVLLMELCEMFDRDVGFAVGMLLLPFVFWPMLGFGSARFRGRRRKSRPVRRPRYDDEDDDYDPPPRRSRRRYDDEDDDY